MPNPAALLDDDLVPLAPSPVPEHPPASPRLAIVAVKFETCHSMPLPIVNVHDPECLAALTHQLIDLPQAYAAFVLGCHGDAADVTVRELYAGRPQPRGITPREVFAAGLSGLASEVIVCQYRPVAEVAPTIEDHKQTLRWLATGLLHQMPLYDHVLVGLQSVFSFRRAKLLVMWLLGMFPVWFQPENLTLLPTAAAILVGWE